MESLYGLNRNQQANNSDLQHLETNEDKSVADNNCRTFCSDSLLGRSIRLHVPHPKQVHLMNFNVTLVGQTSAKLC
jgi:hypothetical protein